MKLIALLSLAWRVAAAASTSPGHVKDRYIVKLCETSWLDREPAETAAALAESVGAKMHVYKHALGGFSVTDCSAEAAEALKNKPEVCSVLPWRRRSHSMAINFWGKNRENDTKVAILMGDSRSIRDHNSYLPLSYRINKHYAKLHGYQMMFRQYPCIAAHRHRKHTHDESATCYGRRYPDLAYHFCDKGGCDGHALHDHFRDHGRREGRRFGCEAARLTAAEAARWEAEAARARARDVQAGPQKQCACALHPVHGARAAPWCKILAINHTLHSYPDLEWILYIDSDAFVQNMDQPLRIAFQNTTSDITVTYNFPWVRRPANSGIMFIHNTRSSREIFKEWWDSKSSNNMVHDFEQSLLPSLLFKYPSSFSVLKLKTFVDHRKIPQNRGIPQDQSFVHVGSAMKHRRIFIMKSHIKKLGIP